MLDADGKIAAQLADVESIPILAGAELSQSVIINQALAPGNYTVKYRIDFGDGGKATEGVTDLVVKPAARQIASSEKPAQKP